MATNSSTRLTINLGSQANDGTGEAIREAFTKVNTNFETIFNVAGLGSGLQFTKLADAPRVLTANKVLITDNIGLTLTQMSFVGDGGIEVSVNQSTKQVIVNATVTNLINDPAPTLGANLSGGNNARAIKFKDPVDDQDLATKKWIYDNFLNRDSNYQYISSTNPLTGVNTTATVVEGSTLRHNIKLVPDAINNAQNVGKTISVINAAGSTVTVDLSVGSWKPEHLTRKDYVDTKISLQGTETIDPYTGQVNAGFGTMTGPLVLSRDPQETDPSNIAATKAYVDQTGFPSKQNFFVSLTGNDANYTIPPYKRGRSWSWAFRTLQKAAQAALQYSQASEIKLGVYQRKITTDNYKTPVTVYAIDQSSTITDAWKVRIIYTGGAGSDPFIERSIRPGQYLQGVNSNAMAQILNISTAGSNVEEYYEVRYVDYADTFESPITPNGTTGQVVFTLFEPNLIEIPDFWIGYVFKIDSTSGGGEGIIEDLGLYYAPNGNIYNTITVQLSTPLSSTNQINGNDWHVYSNYFSVGEQLKYGQKYNKLEISIMVESGEFSEQLPIRIGDNISVKGDEFRRSVVKPSYSLGTARASISTSKWADVWFRRDTQVDGMVVVDLNKNVDYATTASIVADAVTNNEVKGVITFTLSSGLAPTGWVKKVLTLDDGTGSIGEIKEVQGATFTVNIAENATGERKIASTSAITSGNWHIYAPVNFGYHYLRDPKRELNYLSAYPTQPGGYRNAAKILLDNKTFIQEETIGYINSVYSGNFTYNQTKCERDTSLIIDAVAQDVLFNSTSQSTFAGIQYWNHSSYVGAIAGELTTTTNTISYVSQLAQRIVINDTTGARYQSAVSQNVSLPAATGAQGTIVANDFGEIINILNNGVAGITDNIQPNGLTASADANVVKAFNLLQANKVYMQQEAIAYVEATKTTGFVYDGIKCARDVGYMIDAVCIDLLYGGNRQAIQSGVYYYGYNSSSTALPGEQFQAIAAYKYIKSLLPSIIQGTPVASPKQILVTQNTSGSIGNITQATNAQAKIDIITDIILNGPSVASDPSPLPVTQSVDPFAGYSAMMIDANRDFIIAETIAYITETFQTPFTYNQDLCYRDIGFIVDALHHDLYNGGIWASINAADSYYVANVTAVIQNELVQTLGAIDYINYLAQKVIQQDVVYPVFSAEAQLVSPDPGETASLAVVADLTNTMKEILSGNPDFNPPKYNDQMDIFLMNDATMLRYLGGNGHGGFMKVLDPEGQIKSKSPYTQTCSSFSQSIGRHRFAGGFFVDGFCGNLPLVPTSATASNNANGDPIYIPVSGVRRLPVFPTFFINDGISYEVDYMESYDSANQTGVLVLNPNNPGGISSVSVTSGNTQNEFKPNQANIPITFSNPGTAGAITARGYAITDSNGNISIPNGIVITYPGKGYLDTDPPAINIGGATFNFTISGGVITNMTVNYGGKGYTTGTQINIASPGGSGITALATITSVDSNGAITAINLSQGGSGYSSTPTVTFGRQNFSVTTKKGFIGNLPSDIELITSGNRSMLANDFTQLNDLGYGIFATNGGFIENVSMFTYYCYTSYYALNGAQLRTITGSSAYGMYGLIAEGANPLEVPTPVVMADEITQIATVYNTGAYINKEAGADLYVTLDSTYGYAPWANSEVEVNHYGLKKTYSVTNSAQISGQLYSLSIDITGGGLYAAIPDGEKVTIRIKFNWRLANLNAGSITRPSTVLTLNEDPTYNYRVLSYTDLGSDYALTESDQSYNYLVLNPYTQSNLYRQGIGRPVVVSSGTGYTASTSYPITFTGPTTKTAVVNGVQGTTISPVSKLTIGSASGAIHPGMLITGGGALANQYVTWVSLDRTTIQTSIAQAWSTASAVLTFVGTTATGVAIANTSTGNITGVTITDPGVGYDTAPTVTVGSPAVGTSATVSVTLSGLSGTSVIKVLPLSGADTARITTGLTSSTVYNYVFGYEGETYKITDYKTPAQTGQQWGEVTLTGYNNAYTSLTREITADPLYSGVSKNTNGAVTIQISTLRATAHDMVDIGTGGYATSKIPNDLYGPPTLPKNPANETKELNKGRVYFVTTDQDGNFRVGKYFSVDQGRGTVTISAPISLTGISKLSFKKGVEVDEFSKDDTMAANSLRKVPVESAIIGYLDHRLGVDRNGAVASAPIGPGFIARSGILPMTGPLNMGSKKITNLDVPTNSADASTKGYTDGKISLDGMDEVSNDGGQAAGIMAGPLRLNADPSITTASNSVIVNSGNATITLNSVTGLYLGMQINNSAFPAGTTITNIDSNNSIITVSNNATGSLSIGSIITFDPVRQGATKRYVDKVQFNTLRDVTLTNGADTDIIMLGGALTANSATTTPLYTATRNVVNVSNNTASITNGSTSNGGGSDVTLSRSGNSLTIKLVGGQGANNPITDYHVNNNAAIQQSKLLMNTATVSASSAGIVQASRGLAIFDSAIFTATNGWISLLDSVGTTTGVAPSKIRISGAADGGLLGSTTANTSTSYLSSSTVRNWLQVLSAAGGTFSGDLNVNNVYANANTTYDIGSTSTKFNNFYATTIYATTGKFGGNVTDNNNRVLTSVAGSSYISVSGTAPSLTVTNTGVLTLAGTANQVFVGAGSATAATTGTITLSLPQDIHTTASPTFDSVKITNLRANGGTGQQATVYGTWTLAVGATFQATYADLAERYTSDAQYEPGTVLVFGGEYEVTTSTVINDRRVAGVVSTNPAYNMNTSIEGVDIALQGRVPCKVVGTIKKGDMMVTSNIPGVATSNNDPKVGTVIGKALEDYDSTDVGVIEVAVGRL